MSKSAAKPIVRVAAIAAAVGSSLIAAGAVALWLSAARQAQVSPRSYWQYPIRRVGSLSLGEGRALFTRLGGIGFSPTTQQLHAYVSENLEDAEVEQSQEHLVLEPLGKDDAALVLNFVNSGPPSAILATQDTQMRLAAATYSSRGWFARVWQFVPVSTPEGTAYQRQLMSTFPLTSGLDHRAALSPTENLIAITNHRVRPSDGKNPFRVWIGSVLSEDAEEPTDFIHTIEIDHEAIALAFSPDGKTLVTAHVNDTVYLWDTETGQQIRELAYDVPSPPRSNWEGKVIFSADSTQVAMVDASAAYLWQVDTGDLLNTFSLSNDEGTNIWYHTESLAMSNDGRWLASNAGHSNKTYFWDAASGELLRVLRSSKGDQITFNASDTQLAVGDRFGEVTVWQLPTQLK